MKRFLKSLISKDFWSKIWRYIKIGVGFVMSKVYFWGVMALFIVMAVVGAIIGYNETFEMFKMVASNIVALILFIAFLILFPYAIKGTITDIKNSNFGTKIKKFFGKGDWFKKK